MMKTICAIAGLLAVPTEAFPASDEENAGAKAQVEEVSTERRELFPIFSVHAKHHKGTVIARSSTPAMSMSDRIASNTKGPINAIEKLALSEDLNTVISSGDFCTRRTAMARAAGLAAGLALSAVNAPGFAAETKTVKMGSDNGQLIFVPDDLKICKGDTVTWVNNKSGPHNVVFDEDNIPSGVSQESISMDDQLGEEGDTYSKKFDVAGTYGYYCEPHRGAGMNGVLTVA